MSALKDNLTEQDPDYVSSVPNNEIQQKALEENARANTARKITDIVEKEFSTEIDAKEKEVLQIHNRLHKALKLLHLLRYVIVTDFYNRKQCQVPDLSESKQTRIHPAVKELIGKSPKCIESNFINADIPSTSKDPRFLHLETSPQLSVSANSNNENNAGKKEDAAKPAAECSKRSISNNTVNNEPPKKIPRYIPPKSSKPEPSSPSRGVHQKVRHRLVVGNISRWIPKEWREKEDASSHKWTMYVRSIQEDTDIGEFVEKVRFFLHASYQPHDVVEVTSPPFHLSRRGWGEFPVRVQLHFKNPSNKPIDIIHMLKLDKTFTGLQTLGSETQVDIWIHTKDFRVPSVLNSSDSQDDSCQDNKNQCSSNIPSELIMNSNSKTNNIEQSNACASIEESTGKNEKVCDTLTNYIKIEHDYARRDCLSENNRTIVHMQNGTPENVNVTNHEKTNGLPETNGLHNKMSDNQLVALAQEVGKRHQQLSNNIQKECMEKMALSFKQSPAKMQPLNISIPQNLDTSRKKQILILKNNKLLPVNSVGLSLVKHNSVIDKSLTPEVKTSDGDKKSLINLNVVKPVTNVKPILISPMNTFLFNAKCSVPALQIMPVAQLSQLENQYSQENGCEETLINNTEDKGKMSKAKTISGKDKYNITNKKDTHEDILRHLDDERLSNTLNLIKYIIRRLPLITENASDPEYKRLHPYASLSIKEFMGYNIGKQKAYEWYRAKAVRSLMKKCNIPCEKLWSVKEIIIWARRHGYTPITSFLDIHKSLTVKNESSEKMPCPAKAASFTRTEPVELKNWLLKCNEINRESQSDIEIDIESITINADNKEKRNSVIYNSAEMDRSSFLEIPEHLQPLFTFVNENTRNIGLRLGSELIIPGIRHCAAARVMMQAVQCLVDDIVRLSFAQALERSSNDKNRNTSLPIITLDDVRGAISIREEFELFTNAGLGSKQESAEQETSE